MENQTIVSQATPVGRSSVAVVRLSGNLSFSISNKLANSTKPRKHLETALLPIFDSVGRRIDSGVYTFFKGPASYTGEDVVEISCHGNPVVVRMILDHSVCLGSRLAEPGEYTKRAFLNGKMSLSQAESVGAFIAARSENAIYHNNKNIEGASSKRVKEIKKNLMSALSALEYELDISEEDKITTNTIKYVLKELKNSKIECNLLLESFRSGVAFSSGFRVVIVGRPNVGKSTLMNALTGLNRSIVSAGAGTTRDTITHELTMDGYPITMVDTAGIRDGSNSVEIEGVERTANEIAKADIVLSVYTKNSKPIVNIEDKTHLNVFNKHDLHKNKKPNGSEFCISALSGAGLEKLNKALSDTLSNIASFSGDVFINTERQKRSVAHCKTSIIRSMGALSTGPPSIEIAAYELKEAISSLNLFLGKTTTDEILEEVFSTFCVGK